MLDLFGWFVCIVGSMWFCHLKWFGIRKWADWLVGLLLADRRQAAGQGRLKRIVAVWLTFHYYNVKMK